MFFPIAMYHLASNVYTKYELKLEHTIYNIYYTVCFIKPYQNTVNKCTGLR